jgi:hypothetical protein
VKRPDFLDSLRNWLPALPRLSPVDAAAPLQFASAGGGGGGNYDDPDEEYFDDEDLPEEPAPRRRRTETRRPTAARQRTVQTDPDDRYWTDYLRIALPVIGLLLVIAVFWYWAQQLIDDDNGDLTPTEQPGVAELVETATVEATAPPASPTVATTQNQLPSTPQNPLQALPSPTPEGEAAEQAAAEGTDNQAEQPADEGAGAGEIAPDTQVSVIEGPLNMRAEATTGSDVVVELDTGAVLTVLTGPEEGEDYIWWQVTDEVGNVGWVVEEFIQPAE